MSYNWQLPDWPHFRYDYHKFENETLLFIEKQGRISGLLDGLNKDLKEQSIIDQLVQEAIKTSEIEGEFLDRQDVLSSIRNKLGLNKYPENIKDKRSKGIAQLILSLRETYQDSLSDSVLFNWHEILMESYMNVNIGCWRSGEEPMQIISGPIGKEVVHFEAPPSKNVKLEMDKLIGWFNRTAPGKEEEIKSAPIRAAIAHLYFESIHPFEDGNGRVGRALSEKALMQSSIHGFLISLSPIIESCRQDYYDALKKTQRSNQINDWLKFFIDIIIKAQENIEDQIHFTLKKSLFFDKYLSKLNSRQEKAINKMFEAGKEGFKGGMTARKYISINRTSKATATRDLVSLAEMGVLRKTGSGRSVKYDLNLENL